jgi:hypothetical protein
VSGSVTIVEELQGLRGQRMNCDPLFAIAYQVMPELRAEYSGIMRAFWVRALAVAIGLIWAYVLLRSRFSPSLHQKRDCPSRASVRGFLLCGLTGVILACLLWLLVEFMAGGYWFWEAVQEGASREVTLAVLGVLGWSFVLGDRLRPLFHHEPPVSSADTTRPDHVEPGS